MSDKKVVDDYYLQANQPEKHQGGWVDCNGRIGELQQFGRIGRQLSDSNRRHCRKTNLAEYSRFYHGRVGQFGCFLPLLYNPNGKSRLAGRICPLVSK